MSRPSLSDLCDAVSLAAVDAFALVPEAKLMDVVPAIRRELAAVWLGSTDTGELLRLVADLQQYCRSEPGCEVLAALSSSVRRLSVEVQQ